MQLQKMFQNNCTTYFLCILAGRRVGREEADHGDDSDEDGWQNEIEYVVAGIAFEPELIRHVREWLHAAVVVFDVRAVAEILKIYFLVIWIL
jgi:hypothetical protein